MVGEKLLESLKVGKCAMGKEIRDCDVREGGTDASTLALVQVAVFHALPVVWPMFRVSQVN